MHSPGHRGTVNRPVRVKLGGMVLALVRLENGRQVRAKLHQISVSGGLLHMEKPLDEGIAIEVIFHLRGKTVRSPARALFPMWATQGYLQPFEFQNLAAEDRSQLQADIDSLLQGSMATVMAPDAVFTDAAKDS